MARNKTGAFQSLFLTALSVAVLALIIVPGRLYGADLTPREVMQTTLNKLVEIVEEYPGDQELRKRRGQLREVITPKFDFQEMSKRSLGPHWNKISGSEQTEFVDAFSELLARTYLSRIENVRRNMVTVDSEKVVSSPSGTISKALVKTTVVYKGDEFPIDYKLFRRGETRWRVYDVIIENIGLVANYRNEFAGIIRKDEFSGLLEKLRKKVNKPESGSKKS